MTNQKRKVLITDAVHPVLIDGLIANGYEVDYEPEIGYDKVKNSIAKYNGLIINSKILCDASFIDHGTQLKFIARLGSGREVVDIHYAESKGICVYFSPEGNKNAVAEQALGMLLVLANQILLADQQVRAGIWEREARRGWELSGKTIGIIGFGHTGSQFAKKLAGMEMNILVYDKYLHDLEKEVPYIKEVPLPFLLEHSDIISIHLPLGEDTFHLVDHSFLWSMKQEGILINTSRGNVVHTEALIEALEAGRLAGACLDVFENEKPGTFTSQEKLMYQRLYQLPNVVLTPHIAGWTVQSKYKLAAILLEKIAQRDLEMSGKA
ncbi:MAG: hydroxyacid dehydrogenase [Saprospiraceae bacterium]|jgi:D-3-phosphoglycerate dehydrogenase|nr:hydroxyacid dehydrogenase [Saprospiraceae bacterium]MBK6480626.1 hydroxyacid dehydrogenase [Saprospiraceae bacterium]MBK6817014.1 hydroxyacid dehydrogenase [Saprospiraceae bacterium]MBK7435959.1 hydroxyacid dehydrogenase [Saprospiraceae bacterium]MBK7606604.1 hydroxyacid dehydrogenase [Saprospiraceae bacterium]